jgi:toxin FitB
VILVDTNVLSEPLRASGDPRVVAWLDRQEAGTLYLSTITVAEILFGILALPLGRRRTRLTQSFESEILRLFAGRILPFDVEAARAYASLMSAARAKGLSISFADGQIAAIAAANGLAMATRDEAPFRAAGLKTIDPWTE